jgi:ribonuclease BN (tRNA processing enzyme)
MNFPTENKLLNFTDDPSDLHFLSIGFDDVTKSIYFKNYSGSFQKKYFNVLLDWIFKTCVRLTSLSISCGYSDRIEINTLKTYETKLKHIYLNSLKKNHNFSLYEQLITISRKTLESLEFVLC